jgi:hypothetical protein
VCYRNSRSKLGSVSDHYHINPMALKRRQQSLALTYDQVWAFHERLRMDHVLSREIKEISRHAQPQRVSLLSLAFDSKTHNCLALSYY